MARAAKTEIVEIKPVKMASSIITIQGDTPLVVHKWSFKALMEMLDKNKIKKKIPRNPIADVAAALYWMDAERDPFPALPFTIMEGGGKVYDTLIEKYVSYTESDFRRDAEGARFGFPVTAIKKAAISSAFRNGMSRDKVSMQGAFFLCGEGEQQLCEIKFSELPSIRQDFVRVGMGTADIRYRPQFENWSMDLTIRYNENGTLKLSEIINIINLGGQTNGIGEWRIEKSGQYGSFHVAES